MKRKGFTLIELLVVIAIIALLLAILMPSLRAVKNQAKALVCRTQLRALGLWFNLYTEDNDGHFPQVEGAGSGSQWRAVIDHYNLDDHISSDTYHCPATKPGAPKPFRCSKGPPRVSYGLNRWIYYYPSQSGGGGFPYANRWMTPIAAGSNANNVPLLGDALKDGGFPKDTDIAPKKYDTDNPNWKTKDRMMDFLADRHPRGTANFVFLDWSVRDVTMRGLWKLKWHKEYNVGGAAPSNGWPARGTSEINYDRE